jgi:hypothetical protein
VDYGKLPVTDLLRGPLLHTPQGLIVVVYALVYLGAGAVVWLLQLPPPIGKTLEVFLTLCLLWPFIVFLMFVRHSNPAFNPSWTTASWIAVYGALPALFRIYDGLRT